MAVVADVPLSTLISQAESLALRRQEELNAIHLFAALSAGSGRVADMLRQTGAGFRRVLDTAERIGLRVMPESRESLLHRVRSASRAFGVRTADSTHLLIALLSENSEDLNAVLEHLKVDKERLFESATRLAQGQPATKRSSGASLARGVVLPVTPLPQSAMTRRRAGNASNPQAISVIPQVGPAPLPGRRATASPLTSSEGAAPQDSEVEDLSALLGTTLPGAPSETSTAARSSAELPSRRTSSREAESREPLSQAAAPEERPAVDVTRYILPKKVFPILTQVGRNLTLLAAQGQLDEVVGRDEEIEEALDVLAKRQANNPCLVGGAGVGKSSVARGIAARIFEDSLQNPRENRLVIEIPISELLAGTGVRGALAGRVNALKKEVKLAEGRVILFFDEIHQLFSGDAAEEVASDLKLTLSRGELPCIGATQTEEYRKVFEGDSSLARRFSAVEIEEPSREDAYVVLSSVAKKLEHHHDVTIEEDALKSVIDWSLRFLPGRCLPDKAVAIVDLAGARAMRRGRNRVDRHAVAEVVASQASMPLERLLESDGDRMMQLEESLQTRVIGHEEHLGRVARILRRNAAGIGTRRPIGTFLLLGPTGVGKTETAKAIAEVLFHDQAAMTRIDMAEMSEAHAVAKLVGAPPGYVGHDAGGQLTEAVRRRPYQVLLLDEIEKAHPEVLTAFLAVFDEGRMTDSRGRLVDFTNTVIILTSNLGADVLRKSAQRKVGFSANQEENYDPALDKMLALAKGALPPELYNRIDEVLAFAPLSRKDVMKIGEKMVSELSDELELSRGVRLRLSEGALSLLLEMGGFDAELGARPLRRMLARSVEAPLAEAILAGGLQSGQMFCVHEQDGELVFETQDYIDELAAQ